MRLFSIYSNRFRTREEMKSNSPSKLISLILFLLFAAASCAAQTSAAPAASPDDKAEKIVQRGIQAVGGDRYLSLKTVTGHGFFTDYKDGVSGIPVRFVDYISFPDRERTEFTGGGMRIVQTNFGEKGWLFDGAAKTLKDQTADQLEDFKIGIGHGRSLRRKSAARRPDTKRPPR